MSINPVLIDAHEGFISMNGSDMNDNMIREYNYIRNIHNRTIFNSNKTGVTGY